MRIFLDLSYYALFYLSLFLPGYVLVRKLRQFSTVSGVELCLGYAATLLFYALLATCAYIFGWRPIITRSLTLVVLIASLIELLRCRYYRALWQMRFSLICLLLMSLLAIAFISLSYQGPYHIVPDPQPVPGAHYNTLNVKVLNVAHTQANDNYVPYRQAQFFINRSDPAKDSFIVEWGVYFFERTPLMGAITANYFNLLGDRPPIGYLWNQDATDPQHSYLQFQILASLLNNIFVIPAFFLLSYIFSKKTALLSCLFLIVSQFFLYDTVFSWPKSFVAFFILSAWLLLLTSKKRNHTLVAGLLCGAAYLTHDLAILYIGATVLYLLYSRRFWDTVLLVAPPFLCALAWLIVARTYGQSSSFIYYPLSTQGLPPLDGKGIVRQFVHTNPFRLIYIRLFNLVYLLSPYQVLTSEGGQNVLARNWALGLFSVPGAVGYGLLPALIIALWKRLAKPGFLILALGPVLFEVLFIGWPKGLGALHFAEASVVLLGGLSIYYLSKLKQPNLLMAAYFVACIQYGVFIVYSYHFPIHLWLTRPRDIAIIIFMSSVVGGIGWAIWRICHDKKLQLLYN